MEALAVGVVGPDSMGADGGGLVMVVVAVGGGKIREEVGFWRQRADCRDEGEEREGEFFFLSLGSVSSFFSITHLIWTTIALFATCHASYVK